MRLLPVLLLGLALFASACGGDDEAASPTATSTSEATALPTRAPAAAAATATPAPQDAPNDGLDWTRQEAWSDPEAALLAMARDVLKQPFQPSSFENLRTVPGTVNGIDIETTIATTSNPAGDLFFFAYGEQDGQPYGGYVFVQVRKQPAIGIERITSLLDTYFKGPAPDAAAWKRTTGRTTSTLWEAVTPRPDGGIDTWSAYTFDDTGGPTIAGGVCILFANSPLVAQNSCFVNE